MSNGELLEQLASIEHDQWIYWTKGLFKDYEKLIKLAESKKLDETDNQFIKQQSERLERWQRLWNTPYSDLTEDYKEDDRLHARKVIEVIKSQP